MQNMSWILDTRFFTFRSLARQWTPVR
jgi:hypothetical protein